MKLSPRRAQVVGTGLIGGSLGMALRAQGWHVSGTDSDASTIERALALGAVDEAALDPGAEICFVAVPPAAVGVVAARCLASSAAVVTDVASVKAAVMAVVDHPRFVGGHPMAGSEQDGIDGSRADMFERAVWVLTPSGSTDPTAHALVHSVVASLGADVVTLSPEVHDRIVAMVSHVPHLTAATLMEMAAGRAAEQGAVLRLAAGGFRDMTRIAAGNPGIWPDICAENRVAIVEVLDDLIVALGGVRRIVETADATALGAMLAGARAARLSLPASVAATDEVCEMRVSVADEPGQLARVTALATDLDINIYDIEIAHSAEGGGGVLILLVGAPRADELRVALVERGFGVSSRALS